MSYSGAVVPASSFVTATDEDASQVIAEMKVWKTLRLAGCVLTWGMHASKPVLAIEPAMGDRCLFYPFD